MLSSSAGGRLATELTRYLLATLCGPDDGVERARSQTTDSDLLDLILIFFEIFLTIFTDNFYMVRTFNSVGIMSVFDLVKFG